MAYSDEDLKEIRQEFADDEAEWGDIRQEGAEDMRHVAGDPWDPKDRLMREAAGRPCITVDELGQYVNQGINELRINKRSVKFTPIGDGATDDSAKFYENKMREIEYRSRAQIAYLTAAENMFQRSYGFVRVNVKYESARSTNQDIWIEPVHNPDLCTPDPYALMPDMSDQKRFWLREPWPLAEFNRTFGKDYAISGRAHGEFMAMASTWVQSNTIFLAERWKVRTKKRTLLVIQPKAQSQPGSVLGLQQGPAPVIAKFKDELEKEGTDPQKLGEVVDMRKVDDPSVYMCLTNGIDILEETEWPGKFIPFVACLGKVLYVDNGAGSKRQVLSLVRLARDPYMAYCFYRTCEMENVGMTTKNPYWAYEGQLDPQQVNEIAKSLHEPVAVLFAKATTDALPNSEILPLPQRNVSEPAIQALSVGAEEMRRAIQAAMGQSPLPTAAQRRNEKSGVALQHMEDSAQQGSFHFRDHYEGMITQVGIICEDLIDKVYDSTRQVGIRKANDSAEIVTINDPNDPKTSTKGSHLVTVSTGPDFDSEREAANDFSDTLVQNIGIVAQVSGPKAAAALLAKSIKLKNLGPVGDEMVEIIEPPEYKQGEAAQIPPQVQAAMTQLKAENDALKQAHALEMAKQQATIEKAKIDARTQVYLRKMQDATAIAVANINARAKGIIADNQATLDAIALDHDALLQAHDQAHETAMAEMGHQQALQLAEQANAHAVAQGELDQDRALEAGEQGHQQALQQGEAAHQQALEQGDQSIAGNLAVQAAKPAPEAGGNG